MDLIEKINKIGAKISLNQLVIIFSKCIAEKKMLLPFIYYSRRIVKFWIWKSHVKLFSLISKIKPKWKYMFGTLMT